MRRLTLEERITRLERLTTIKNEANQNMPDDVLDGVRRYLTELIPREKVWSRRGVRDYIGARNFANYVIKVVLPWFAYSEEDIEANRPEIEEMILNWISGKRKL